MAMTPKESFDRMMRGEDPGGKMSALHAKIFKMILRRQAGDLVKEESLESIAFVPKGTEPWTVELVFGEGDLSEEAQLTLAKMRLNSHRMEIKTSGESTRICFFMYTDETEAENHEG
ncbi:MAG: hypothetical protein IJT62_02545 [Oscillospiraceae bacterium]|nr:hypothetical protein [Oscillospiraceae bacterium]